MNIKIITCHHVYNFGASLQAFALASYLSETSHDVQIIDYLPEYLRHYRLWGVQNPIYDKPFVRLAYQFAKLPGRIKARKSNKKAAFDQFTQELLPLTSKHYSSYRKLAADPPKADLFIAGSDQIWNPLFKNGHDPAFFLQFAEEHCRKISYAASISVTELSPDSAKHFKSWLTVFDAISVREESAVSILKELELNSIKVCDPVFLLEKEAWKRLAIPFSYEPYLLVYDFDGNDLMKSIALQEAKDRRLKILSVFHSTYADRIVSGIGPREFLGLIMNAELVLANSFHAIAFSLILHKDFYVIRRREAINVRMTDLLHMTEMEDRMIDSNFAATSAKDIDWEKTDQILSEEIKASKDFLASQIKIAEGMI